MRTEVLTRMCVCGCGHVASVCAHRLPSALCILIGLQGLWKLDSKPPNDFSGKGHHGLIIVGNPTVVTGQVSNAYRYSMEELTFIQSPHTFAIECEHLRVRVCGRAGVRVCALVRRCI